MDEYESKLNEWLSEQSPQDRWELAKTSGEIDLSQIDEIDWASLQTAFGNASNFPALIRASSAPYDYREPLDAIFVDCHCLNELFLVCIPTFPYLIQLLAVDVPDRQEIVLWELWMWMSDIRASRMWTIEKSLECQLRESFISHRDVFVLMADHDSPPISQNAHRVIDSIDATMN